MLGVDEVLRGGSLGYYIGRIGLIGVDEVLVGQKLQYYIGLIRLIERIGLIRLIGLI